MRRLRLIEESDGSTRFVDAETDMVWGIAPATTIERGVDAGSLGVLPPTPRVLLRSSRSVDDAASSFATWSSAGWALFETRVSEAADSVRSWHADAEAVLWPGVGSVLSDGVSALSFARKHPSVGLAIDPVAWLTPSMRRDAEDHLARFAQALSLCETMVAIVARAIPADGAWPEIGVESVESLLEPAATRAGVVAIA